MTREEAIKLLFVEKSTIIEVDGNKGAEKMLQAYDMAIEALSADAVGYETTATINEPISIQSNYVYVVRCKDCRHRYYADNRVPHERTWVCERFMNEEIKSNDFCSWGERSEP